MNHRRKHSIGTSHLHNSKMMVWFFVMYLPIAKIYSNGRQHAIMSLWIVSPKAKNWPDAESRSPASANRIIAEPNLFSSNIFAAI
jgi:hypothetical protein